MYEPTLEDVITTIENRVGLEAEDYEIVFDTNENCIAVTSEFVPFWNRFYKRPTPNWLANELSNYGFTAIAISNQTTHIY